MKFTISFIIIVMFLSCTKFREVPNDGKKLLPPDSLGYGSLLINEYTPKSKVDTNEFGVLGKWFEVYNPGNRNIEIDSNFYLTDTLGWPDKFHVPYNIKKQIVPAKGYLVIWSDNCDTIAGGNYIHTNFSLNSAGGGIGIYYKNIGNEFMAIDTLTYGDHSLLPKGTPIGRFPDGTSGFKQLSFKTPGGPNQL
ncbi:MAG: lamin tail domain-containing protein [Bacteroidetes bacterium]|nr:lamin tail domain-containing protein [Bacteroidota bacterium]